ncbi:MAG: GAF domain-containing protein [Deltaproteobacteria bacterium]|nr:GAF domain-containing protein [Deltaproteobacteria bacterium]
MAIGNLNLRFATDSADEMDVLAATLNKMVDAVSEKHTILSQKISDKTKEIELRTKELIILNKIANSIGRTFSHDDVLNLAMNEVMLMAGADAGWIYLRQSNSDEAKLYLKIHRGLPYSFLKELKEINLEEAAMGQPIMDRKHLLVQVSEINSKYRQFLEEMGIKTLCVMPIIYAENIIGVINLACKGENSFSNTHCIFGEALADELAVAIEYINAFQNERRSKQFIDKVIYQFPISTAVVDKDGTCVILNAACKKLFGIEDNQIVGKYNLFKDNVLEEQGYIPIINRVLKGESVDDMEIEYDMSKAQHIQIQGRPKKVKLKAFPIFDNNGSVINIVLMYEEITNVR